MAEVVAEAARTEPRRGDRIQGWFGDAVITDVACGYVEVEGEEPGPVDDLVRIRQFNRKNQAVYRYIYRADIERNLTAEQAFLRA